MHPQRASANSNGQEPGAGACPRLSRLLVSPSANIEKGKTAAIMPVLHRCRRRSLLEGAEVEIFKLMSYGATPERWAEWLRAPLEHAAARGNFDLVQRLLKAGANGGAGWRGCRGRTLLDAAALGGNEHVVTALLQAGCVPDVPVVSVSSGR